MYACKINYIIYASTCTIYSSIEYVYENLFEIKKNWNTNEKKLNGKHKMKMENTK
jgi:hypothetical protein